MAAGADGARAGVLRAGVACWGGEARGADGASHAVSTAWRGTFSASEATVVEDEHGVCVEIVVHGVCVGVSTACCDSVIRGNLETTASTAPVDEAQGVLWTLPIGAARTALRLPAARTPAVRVLKCIVCCSWM